MNSRSEFLDFESSKESIWKISSGKSGFDLSTTRFFFGTGEVSVFLLSLFSKVENDGEGEQDIEEEKLGTGSADGSGEF